MTSKAHFIQFVGTDDDDDYGHYKLASIPRIGERAYLYRDRNDEWAQIIGRVVDVHWHLYPDSDDGPEDSADIVVVLGESV